MTTSTCLLRRQTDRAVLETAEQFQDRVAKEIATMEYSGWAVRQVMQVQDHHAFFVVFER